MKSLTRCSGGMKDRFPPFATIVCELQLISIDGDRILAISQSYAEMCKVTQRFCAKPLRNFDLLCATLRNNLYFFSS
jgi:hypothetical protein